MKNVDKQWNKRGCNSIDECEQIGDCRDCKDVWVAGFKVALAWVLNTFEKNIDTQADEDRVDVYKMVADELEATK